MGLKDTTNKLNLVILICLQCGLSFIPFSLFIDNETTVLTCQILVQIISLFFIINFSSKEKLFVKKEMIEEKLMVLPLFIIAFSNLLIFPYYSNYSALSEPSMWINFFLKIIFYGLIAVNEEIVFRKILLLNLDFSPIASIFFCSLIFAAIHLVNISSVSMIPQTLIQVGYTFVLGIILSFAYLVGGNLIYPILIHVLFNICNNVIFTSFYNGGINYVYYLINVGVGALTCIYLFYLFERKKDFYVSKNWGI